MIFNVQVISRVGRPNPPIFGGKIVSFCGYVTLNKCDQTSSHLACILRSFSTALPYCQKQFTSPSLVMSQAVQLAQVNLFSVSLRVRLIRIDVKLDLQLILLISLKALYSSPHPTP